MERINNEIRILKIEINKSVYDDKMARYIVYGINTGTGQIDYLPVTLGKVIRYLYVYNEMY